MLSFPCFVVADVSAGAEAEVNAALAAPAAAAPPGGRPG